MRTSIREVKRRIEIQERLESWDTIEEEEEEEEGEGEQQDSVSSGARRLLDERKVAAKETIQVEDVHSLEHNSSIESEGDESPLPLFVSSSPSSATRRVTRQPFEIPPRTPSTTEDSSSSSGSSRVERSSHEYHPTLPIMEEPLPFYHPVHTITRPPAMVYGVPTTALPTSSSSSSLPSSSLPSHMQPQHAQLPPGGMIYVMPGAPGFMPPPPPGFIPMTGVQPQQHHPFMAMPHIVVPPPPVMVPPPQHQHEHPILVHPTNSSLSSASTSSSKSKKMRVLYLPPPPPASKNKNKNKKPATPTTHIKTNLQSNGEGGGDQDEEAKYTIPSTIEILEWKDLNPKNEKTKVKKTKSKESNKSSSSSPRKGKKTAQYKKKPSSNNPSLTVGQVLLPDAFRRAYQSSHFNSGTTIADSLPSRNNNNNNSNGNANYQDTIHRILGWRERYPVAPDATIGSSSHLNGATSSGSSSFPRRLAERIKRNRLVLLAILMTLLLILAVAAAFVLVLGYVNDNNANPAAQSTPNVVVVVATSRPSTQPTAQPITPSFAPSFLGSTSPSRTHPSLAPSPSPSWGPSPMPSTSPSRTHPSTAPSPEPTLLLSSVPTTAPTAEPTTTHPSFRPSQTPTQAPSASPVSSIQQYLAANAAISGGREFEDPNSYASQALRYVESLAITPLEELVPYYALACIFYASNGVHNKRTLAEFPTAPQLPNWFRTQGWVSNNMDKCLWDGITCNNNEVVEINLAANRMFGKLAPEVQLFAPTLQVLNVFANAFIVIDGDIGWLASMTRLTELNLGSTAFEHNGVPSLLQHLTNLEQLDISDTKIEGGPIRGQAFVGLEKLVSLDLGGNAYTGTIPPEITGLISLRSLVLERAEFGVEFQTQQISLDFLTAMPSTLEEFRMDATNAMGLTLPVALPTSLRRLSLSKTGLVGNIPDEMGQLSNLAELALHDNDLDGMIPTELFQLSRLETLYLQGNPRLVGAIPDTVWCPIPIALGADCVAGGNVLCPCCTCCGSTDCRAGM